MITRTYECVDCHQYFEVDHDSGEEDCPPCPACDVVLEWRPQRFNIGTVKGKSVDVAQKIIEEDFLVTNFKDNTREGETCIIEPPQTREQRDERARMQEEIRAAANATAEPNNPALAQQIKGFFGGQGAAAPQIDINQALAASRSGPGAYTRDNNPMTMLHQAGKSGLLPNNMRIIAKA